MSRLYSEKEIITAVMAAREEWDEGVCPDDDARIAARIGALNVLSHLD